MNSVDKFPHSSVDVSRLLLDVILPLAILKSKVSCTVFNYSSRQRIHYKTQLPCQRQRVKPDVGVAAE